MLYYGCPRDGTLHHDEVAVERSIYSTLAIDSIVVWCVCVLSQGGDIVFLHRVVGGVAPRSYGIHVAQLAGTLMILLLLYMLEAIKIYSISLWVCVLCVLRSASFRGAKGRGNTAQSGREGKR